MEEKIRIALAEIGIVNYLVIHDDNGEFVAHKDGITDVDIVYAMECYKHFLLDKKIIKDEVDV